MRTVREMEGVFRSYSEHAKRLLNESIAILSASSVTHVVHHPHDKAIRFEVKNCMYSVTSDVFDPTCFDSFISHCVLAGVITGETQFCQPITTRFELGGGVQR